MAATDDYLRSFSLLQLLLQLQQLPLHRLDLLLKSCPHLLLLLLRPGSVTVYGLCLSLEPLQLPFLDGHLPFQLLKALLSRQWANLFSFAYRWEA